MTHSCGAGIFGRCCELKYKRGIGASKSTEFGCFSYIRSEQSPSHMEHPSLAAPEVYIWKKIPYGRARGGRVLSLHDGEDAWMFWSTFWRDNKTRAELGELFHVSTRLNKGGTLNVAKITRCSVAPDCEADSEQDSESDLGALDETFGKLDVKSS